MFVQSLHREMPSKKRIHWWVKLPVSQQDFSLADHIRVDMLSLPSLLVRDFLLSKCYIQTRLQIYYDLLQHGAWTSWHSRFFFVGQQGGFVQLGVALPILHDTTHLQVFLLLYGHGLPVFLEDAVSILDLSVRVFAFKMSFRQFLISSSTRSLSAILPSRNCIRNGCETAN